MICVDANVVVALILFNQHTAGAEALFAEHQRRDDARIIAVDLLGYEITNAVRQHVRAGLPQDDARERLSLLPAFGIELHPAARLHDRALVISRGIGLRATYDAHYVALAEAFGCDLWTADRRLVNATQATYPFVRWLGDFG